MLLNLLDTLRLPNLLPDGLFVNLFHSLLGHHDLNFLIFDFYVADLFLRLLLRRILDHSLTVIRKDGDGRGIDLEGVIRVD